MWKNFVQNKYSNQIQKAFNNIRPNWALTVDREFHSEAECLIIETWEISYKKKAQKISEKLYREY